MKGLWRRIFWERCKRHNVSFDSDFCPQCIRERTATVPEHRESEPSIQMAAAVRRALDREAAAGVADA